MSKKKTTGVADKNSPGQKTDSNDRTVGKKRNDKSSSTSTPRLNSAPAKFTELFYAHVMKADLALFSEQDRQRMAASVWHLAQKRKPRTLNLRLFNPSPVKDGWTVDHTVLETVNDDMPFLVDSITGELQRRGLSIHLVIHPVMQLRRNAQGELLDVIESGSKPAEGSPGVGLVQAESLMHIQFDHVLDPDILREIEADIRDVLSDVRAAVEDWPAMRKRMAEATENAEASRNQESADENTAEAREFMRWLDDNNFTYLGYRDIDLVQENGKLVAIKVDAKSGLGVLRNPEIRAFGGLRDANTKSSQIQNYVRQNHLLVVSKTNLRSRVHRNVTMDAIFVRRFDKAGDIVGERLFVGLFTSQSYSQRPREIPFLRRKIRRVTERAGLDPRGHDGKALIHILDNYPQDELFQISEDELYRHSLGILQLQDRARVALFLRYDPFGRFATCLIYVPRDRYDSILRGRIQKYLENALGGRADDPNVRIDNGPLARAFITIHLNPSSPRPDIEKLEDELRDLCRAWPDRLRDCLVAEHGEASALALLRRYGEAFPTAYRDVVPPAAAVRDIYNLERTKLLAPEDLTVDISPADESGLLHLKLFRVGQPILLSEALPVVENMGLKIEYTGGPYEVRPQESERGIYIHEFVGRPANTCIVDFSRSKPAFEENLLKVWSGECESDMFNGLSLCAGLGWREVRALRAMARYLRQLRIPYSHEMIAQTFLSHPHVAQAIYALFFARHDPDLKGNRAARCAEIETRIMEALGKVEAIEEDRIIRRYVNLVQASLRTNFFQRQQDGSPKSYLSIKFDSRAVEFMPLPKPLYEIFVYSPQVEAVHLRGGKVARGGIRWSDRRDDFRNEILGLMKAQMVKNSVIVPVGSKGGFIVKRPPAEADKFLAEGIACYRVMMCGMLDITDNRSNGKIIPPERVVRHDADDPYLVVAADKGTAKFSDIANGISQEYGFWLDDAFASGGSAGYDHKGMGITARGAWESVKRHFREIGRDIQNQDFTCVGVGDMSGDVFGNAMLLSKHTRLLGAFDHRHIFLDPDPDAAESYAERQRMFNLPRSSWADYDRKKISKGGGVFPRSEKSIKLTPEIKKAFAITADSLAPSELMTAMLKSKVDLLYFGGIGTYIKAGNETHEEVGDRANEALRIDGSDVGALIVGEGANLGMTQRGRIEYALKGGRLNTDAIDNSAGVDTSDHEVNIKILLRKVVDKGTLSLDARNRLLASMTDEVGKLVLRDNYMQTQALSVAEARAPELLGLHVRSMHALEKIGLLNRDVEFLPHSPEIAERQRNGKGLTRPELAVLLSYSKIWLYDKLLDSSLPDDEFLQDDLVHYFPTALREKYARDIAQHQLRREIIATVLTNSLINRVGSHFMFDMDERTGKKPEDVARAYIVAREAFDLRNVWDAIERLDNKVPAKVQIEMLLAVNETLGYAVQWFLNEVKLSSRIAPVIDSYKKGIEQLSVWLASKPSEVNGRCKKVQADLIAQGIPAQLAGRIAHMALLGTALDLTKLASESKIGIDKAAVIFFGLGQRLGLDWLIERARSFVAETPWQREAVAVIIEDLSASQRDLTGHVVGRGKKGSGDLAGWLAQNAQRIEHYNNLLAEWRNVGAVDIAMLTLASRQLAALLD
ncbi:MAG: NAD-glutamate dehydrogenase [Bdellovibrionales bacterium]